VEITAPPTISYAPDTGKLGLPDGTWLPAAWVAGIELDNGAFVASLSMVADMEGRARCRAFRIEVGGGVTAVRDYGVTAVSLRGIRLGELIRAAVAAAYQRIIPGGGPITWEPITDAAAAGYARPRTLPADREQAIASVYNRAIAANQHPLQAVMRELHIARATASRLIRAAKDHGYITTTRGKHR